MVFSNKEKAVIKYIFLRVWNAYKVSKELSTKSWNRVSAHRLLNIFQEDNSMDRIAASGRQQTITIKESENLIENLIFSQEDNPDSHMSPREVEKSTCTTRNSVRRMVKRRGLKQFKCLKTTMVSSVTQERLTKGFRTLADRIRNSLSIEK